MKDARAVKPEGKQHQSADHPEGSVSENREVETAAAGSRLPGLLEVSHGISQRRRRLVRSGFALAHPHQERKRPAGDGGGKPDCHGPADAVLGMRDEPGSQETQHHRSGGQHGEDSVPKNQAVAPGEVAH